MISFILFSLVVQTLALNSEGLGRYALPNEYPYVVAVVDCVKICSPDCAAVVLSKSWLLTDGGCAYVAANYNNTVYAGVVNVSDPNAQIRKIEKAVLYPEYNYFQPFCGNSIGLLKLETPLEFGDSVQPANLPKQNSDEILGTVTTMRWFNTLDARGTPVETDNLETFETDIVDYDVCMAVLGPSLEYKTLDYNHTVYCTGPLTGSTETCEIKSGAPSVQNGTVVGLNFFASLECGVMGTVVLHTKTGPYIDWILANVDEEINLV